MEAQDDYFVNLFTPLYKTLPSFLIFSGIHHFKMKEKGVNRMKKLKTPS